MENTINFKKSSIIFITIAFLVSSLVVFVSSSANASENTKASDQEIDKEGEFVKNEAIKKDKNGQPVGIDLDKVKQRHGYIPQEAKDANTKLEQQAEQQSSSGVKKEVGSGYKNSNDCFYSEVTKSIKQSLPPTVLSAVLDYAKSGEYAKGAKRLAKAGVNGSGIGTVYTVVSISTQCDYKYGMLNVPSK